MEDVTLEELRRRLGEEGLVVLDVRTVLEFDGTAGNSCDVRHGHIPGARNLPIEDLLDCRSAEDVRALVALPEGVEIVAYCHVGSRSGIAAAVLRAAGSKRQSSPDPWPEGSRDPWPPGEP